MLTESGREAVPDQMKISADITIQGGGTWNQKMFAVKIKFLHVSFVPWQLTSSRFSTWSASVAHLVSSKRFQVQGDPWLWVGLDWFLHSLISSCEARKGLCWDYIRVRCMDRRNLAMHNESLLLELWEDLRSSTNRTHKLTRGGFENHG